MKLFWIGLLLVWSNSFYAQQYRVEGQVKDLHDNSALSHATIQLDGKVVAHTNTKGFFSFSAKEGQYQIHVTHSECQPYTKTIRVAQSLHINIYLEHHTQEIKTVVLHGLHQNRSTAIIKTLDKTALEEKTTENLGNILSNISGVHTLKTGNNISKPVIHGLYGSRILVLNNGVRMAEQEWGVEHAPNVDTNAYEHIDLVRGAEALKYGGDAIGGAVLLESPNYPKKDTIIGKVSLSGISNGKGLALNTDVAKTWQNGWSVRTQGSAKKLGDLQTPHYSLQNTGTEENAFHIAIQKKEYEYGISAKYSLIHQNFGIYKGAHISNAGNFADAINHGLAFYTGNFSYNIENPKQEVSHQTAKIEAYKRFGAWGKFSLAYAYQQNHRYEFDIRRGHYNPKPATDLLLTTQNLSLTHLLQRQGWTLESGVSGGYQVNYPDPKTERSRLIPDYEKYEAGVFSILKYHQRKWHTEIGARYDFNYYDAYKYYLNKDWAKFSSRYPQFVLEEKGVKTLVHPQLYYHNISASVGVHYQMMKYLNAKLNIVHNSRTPNAAELFADGLHHAAAIIEQGDLSLQKENTYQAQLHLDFNNQKLGVSVSPYILWSDSFINQTPNGVQSTIKGNFPVWQYQQIKAKMWGVDAEAFAKINPQWQWNAAFSYVYGQDDTHNEPLILMPPMQVKNTLTYQSKTKNPWHIGVEHLIIFKQQRFPLRAIPYDVYENNTVRTEWLDLSTPPAGYQLVNLNTGIAFNQHLKLNLRVHNLFNTVYRDYLNRLRFFSDALGRNVTLTINYHF
ncbi:TonB-dependent receptor [Riemerella columbina]|uniref:TonB-dependent receptor n=1 Tax=Riemerella columbina TaxID=103810 RepID=UPI00037FE22E|nr:TonB-dependent receptor [Riemerella columbina]